MQEVDAQHIACSLDELVDWGRREHCEDTAALAQLERAEIAQQPLNVASQLRVEEHAISSLEDDLAELHQHTGLHIHATKGR